MAESATLLLDERGIVMNWPSAAERLLGYPAAEMLGHPLTTLLAPDDAARVPEIAERCQADGGWSGVLSARHREGRPAPVEVRIVRLPQGAGGARWLVLVMDAAPSAQWGMGPAVFERMVTQSPVGLAAVDTELRCVWSNTALEQFGGGPTEQRRGRRLAEIQPGLNTEILEAQMRRVLETGEPVVNYEHVGRTQSDPKRDRAHSMSFVRLDDDNGHPLGVCYSVIDITDRYRARRRLALLDRASEHIGRSLDVMQTAQDLADVAVPDLADFVTVDLLDSVIKGAEPTPGPVSETALVGLLRAGYQSVRPGVPEEAVVGPGDVAAYHGWSPPVRCLASGRSWRVAHLDPLAREWATDIPGGRALRFKELGLHTAMVVPILARGTTLGVTAFFRTLRDEAFDEDDLRLAEEFVARAAVCLDNARRYTRERSAALVLQRSLLPHGVPPQKAVDAASFYRPADELSGLGGDWFDVIPLSGARVALVVGEVLGHGIEAAATMGRLRTAVRTLADLDLPPEELLAHLDDLVTQVVREESEGDGGVLPAEAASAGSAALDVGSSCLYVVYDPVSRQCVMASAGHLAPAIVTPDGTVDFPDLPLGPALGIGGLPFESVELTLEEGSVLALYTDGLIASPEAGKNGLRRALQARELPLDQLCENVVDDLAPTRPLTDDAALLLVRTRSLEAGRVATWDLPTDPAVVARAREMTIRQLSYWGLEELAFTTELVVSELITNAIRHASGPIRLRLILERTLICEVSDASSTSPHLRHARTTDEGGRGLFLISQFTHRWGTRYTGEGKIIWAEQLLGQGNSVPDTLVAAAA